MKKKDKKIIYYILAFLIPLALILFIYVFRGIYPFGKKTLLTVDMAGQYVSFFNSLKNIFTGEISALYSFSKTLGGNMFGLISYYLLSPFNLIIMFFNKTNITEAILIINVLKIAACGLTSYIFFNKTFKEKGIVPIIFSTCYALLSYNIIYSQNLLWIDGVIFLPLVFLGIDRLIEKKKPLLFYITLTCTIISNYYIGYMICIGSLVYYIYKSYLFNNYELSWKKNKKEFIYFIKYALLAVGTTCIVLIPSIFSLLAGKAGFDITSFVPKQTYAIIELISRVFIGAFSNVDLEGGCPNIYTSLIILVLTFTYFYNKKINKKEKKATLFLILFFIISFTFYPLDIVWHLFQKPAGFSFRYSFIFDFIILTIAYKNYLNIKGIDNKLFKKLIPPVIILVLIMDKLMYTEYLNYKIIASGVILIGYLLYIYRSKSKKISNKLALIIIAELTINGLFIVNELSYQNKSQYLNFLNNYGSVINEIKENDNSIYRIEKDYSYSTNDPLLLNYYGLSHFSSTYEGNNNSLLGDYLGIFNRFYITNHKGSTPVTNSLFNIKYLLLNKEHQYYKLINKYETEKDTIYIYENNYNLPLAFMVNSSIENLKLSELEPFINQNNIINSMTGKNSNIFFQNFESNIEYDNLKIKEGSEDPYVYKKVNPQLTASITYTTKIKKSGPLYAYISSDYNKKINILVNGETVINTSDQNDYRYNILELGNYDYGDIIELKIILLENQIKFNDVMFYTLDKTKFANQIKTLQNNDSLNIIEFKEDYIKGTIKVTESNQVLYTSIPADDGWTIKVNNKEVKPIKLLDSLIGIELPIGDYEIEMSYIPQGLKLGGIISIVSLISTIVFILRKK